MYLLIVYSPLSHADAIRKAASDAGAGKIGAYEGCSFSSRGTGRFRPMNGANPAIGTPEVPQEVEEERIEMVVSKECMSGVITAIKKVHPYEEPAMHCMALTDINSLSEAD